METMTLHDRLKEIPVEFNTTETGRLVLSDSTITAIIAAFTERLPGGSAGREYWDMGWNEYRARMLKVLGEIPDFTKGGHTTDPYSIDSST